MPGVQGAPGRTGRRQGRRRWAIFIPRVLGMDEGENVRGHGHHDAITPAIMLFLFASGKCGKDPAGMPTPPSRTAASCSRPTATRKRWRTTAFLPEETELAIRTSAGRMLLVGTAQISRQGHPRQSGRGGRHPEEEPAHRCRCVPAETLETGQPPPLPRPQPARHRCPHSRRGRRRAADASVKETMLCKIST